MQIRDDIFSNSFQEVLLKQLLKQSQIKLNNYKQIINDQKQKIAKQNQQLKVLFNYCQKKIIILQTSVIQNLNKFQNQINNMTQKRQIIQNILKRNKSQLNDQEIYEFQIHNQQQLINNKQNLIEHLDKKNRQLLKRINQANSRLKKIINSKILRVETYKIEAKQQFILERLNYLVELKIKRKNLNNSNKIKEEILIKQSIDPLKLDLKSKLEFYKSFINKNITDNELNNQNYIKNQISVIMSIFVNDFEQSQQNSSSINSNLLPLDLQLLNWIESGQDISLNFIEQINQTVNNNSQNKEVIISYGIYDIKEILLNDLLFIIYQFFIVTNLFYSLQYQSIDYTNILLITVLYMLTKLIVNYQQFRKAYKVDNQLEKQTRKYFLLIDFIRILVLAVIMLQLQFQISNIILFMIYIPIFGIIRFTYQLFWQSKQQMINLFFFTIEFIQLFILVLKLQNISVLGLRQIILIPIVYMVYKFILGFFIFILMVSSFFNLFYWIKETWKLKALWVLSVLYIGQGISGLNYLHLFVQQEKLLDFESTFLSTENFYWGLSFSLAQHLLFLIIQLISIIIFKEEYKAYLQRIIYRKLLKKEIYINYIEEKNWEYVQQISQIYYTKIEVANIIQDKQEIDLKDNSDQKSSNCNACKICFENYQNILISPCNHSGLCKECLVGFIKQDINKCPFCKNKIEKFFLFESTDVKSQKILVGEILPY